MARSVQRRFQTPRCTRCHLARLPEEEFHRGLCPACLEADKRYRRRKQGAKLLEKAKSAGTLKRDGQTFQLLVLPAKRRTGRKSR